MLLISNFTCFHFFLFLSPFLIILSHSDGLLAIFQSCNIQSKLRPFMCAVPLPEVCVPYLITFAAPSQLSGDSSKITPSKAFPGHRT